MTGTHTMPSTHTPPSKSAVDKKYVIIGGRTYRKNVAEAVQKTGHSDHDITAGDKPTSTGNPDADHSAANGVDEELSTAEERLLDELQEIITTYG